MFRALEQLYALGALNDKGELTTMGARWGVLGVAGVYGVVCSDWCVVAGGWWPDVVAGCGGGWPTSPTPTPLDSICPL